MAKQKPKEIYVAVCVPSTGFWREDTGKSLVLMTSYFHLHRVPGVHKQKVAMFSTTGSMLSQLRELMVKKVLEGPYTHLLFVDSDMEFPMNGLNRLLQHDVEFVGANCTTRKHPVETTAHDLEGNRIDSRGKTGLEEVQHVGLAFTLIKTSAIRKVGGPPLFLMDWIPPIGAYCGEDVYLCQRLADKGVKLHIDHDVSQQIGHVGTYIYRHEDLDYAGPGRGT